MKVHIILLYFVSWRLLSCTIRHISSRELFEFHDIASKRARLVAKNILYLAKFLIKVARLCPRRNIYLLNDFASHYLWLNHVIIKTHE